MLSMRRDMSVRLLEALVGLLVTIQLRVQPPQLKVEYTCETNPAQIGEQQYPRRNRYAPEPYRDNQDNRPENDYFDERKPGLVKAKEEV